MSAINTLYQSKISLEEIEIIQRKIFENTLPSSLFQSIFSPKKTEDIVQNRSIEWKVQDSGFLSLKVELVRFRFFINDLTHQIGTRGKLINEPTKRFAFQSVIAQLVSMPGMSNYKIDSPMFGDFIRKQRQYIITLVSVLPEGILDLKVNKEVALPCGLFDPNLIQIIWNASWVRKTSGNAGTKSSMVDLKMRVPTIANCLIKVCELGNNDDWRIVANIIEDPKFRSLSLLKTVKKLISKDKINKAREIAETIPDEKTKKRALKRLQI